MESEVLVEASRIDEGAIDALFRNGRTGRAWLQDPVPESLLRELYDLFKLGPTSSNLTPGRFVFVTSAEAKERLIPALALGNVEKTKAAPVTVIVAYDTEFYLKGPFLSGSDFREAFEGKPDKIDAVGRQSANLQAAYLILAARALGLAAGPMGGFEPDLVDREFFPDGKWRSILLINLGHPDPSTIKPRAPRLPFEEAAEIV